MRDLSAVQVRSDMPFQAAVHSAIFDHLNFDAYVFETEVKVARAFLPSAEYSLVEYPFGKCLTALLCTEYSSTDGKTYNEMALCLPLAAFGPHLLPNWLSALLDFRLNTLHAYILHLPVHTGSVLQSGPEAFGVSRILAGISYSKKGNVLSCGLTDSDDRFVALRISPPRSEGFSLGPQALKFYSYPVREGHTQRMTLSTHFADLHINPYVRSIRLETGNGEMAEAASLLLKRPVMALRAYGGHGIFNAPELLN